MMVGTPSFTTVKDAESHFINRVLVLPATLRGRGDHEKERNIGDVSADTIFVRHKTMV